MFADKHISVHLFFNLLEAESQYLRVWLTTVKERPQRGAGVWQQKVAAEDTEESQSGDLTREEDALDSRYFASPIYIKANTMNGGLGKNCKLFAIIINDVKFIIFL